jgi:hypothetical protein
MLKPWRETYSSQATMSQQEFPSYYYCQTCRGLLSDTDIFCGHYGRKTGDRPNNFLDAACGVCLAFSLALFVMTLTVSPSALFGSIVIWFAGLVLALVSRRRILAACALAILIICSLVFVFFLMFGAMATLGGCDYC